MPTQSMKERVDALERDLLAINCLSNIIGAASNGNGVDLAQSDVAFLLEYLSDESLQKVEGIRLEVDRQAAAPSPALVKAPPAADRRRKKTTLAAVA